MRLKMTSFDFDFVFYCDSYEEIGLGHLSRSIHFASELTRNNSQLKIAFYGKYSENAINHFYNSIGLNQGITLLLSDKSRFVHSEYAWLDTMFTPGSLDLNYDVIKNIKAHCEKLVYFSDVCELLLPAEVDMYFNHLPFAKIQHNNEQEVYIGFDYLPAPREFYYLNHYDARKAVLAVIGSCSDPALVDEFIDYLVSNISSSIQVILSPHFASKHVNDLKDKYDNIAFTQNVSSLIPYFNNASAIITTYGNTTYQAIAGKVPVFTFGLYDFQDEYGKRLEKAGYSIHLGYKNSLDKSKCQLLDDKILLAKQHDKLSSLISDPGITRIVNIVLESNHNV